MSMSATQLLWICLVYVLASVCGTHAGYESKADCDKLTKRSQCECFHEYIKCGPITLNTYKVLHQIRCNTTIEVKDYELLPNLKVGNLSKLTLTNCPFPDKFTIKDALQRLGITGVTELKVQNGFDVTDGRLQLEHQHYEDMPGFKQLALYRFRQVLPEDYFAACKNINELILSGYSDLPATVLRPLENLERLKIFVQNMGEISGELFSMQHQLKDIDLDCTMENANEDKSVLSGVMLSQLGELRQFVMRYCGDGIPRIFFKQNPKLELIEIRSDVKTLDKDLLSKQGNLLTLKLSHNKLEGLHVDFLKPTPKLRELHLAHNKFTKLPSKIFDHVKYLQVLNLESNPLTIIDPNAFKNIKGKIYLDKLYPKVISGELKLNSDATFCKEEFIFGVCRYCKREEYLQHFGTEECKAVE